MLRIRGSQKCRFDDMVDTVFQRRLAAFCAEHLGEAVGSDLERSVEAVVARGRAWGLRHQNTLCLYTVLSLALGSDMCDELGCADLAPGETISDYQFLTLMREEVVRRHFDALLEHPPTVVGR